MKKGFLAVTALATIVPFSSAFAAMTESECAKGTYGAGVSVTFENDKCVAHIDGDSQTEALQIAKNFTVDSAIYIRGNVVKSKPQTFVSPFTSTNCSIGSNVRFGLLNRIYVNTKKEWKTDAVTQTSLQAHKPYVFEFSAVNDGKVGAIEIGGDGCVVEFGSTTGATPIHEFVADSAKDHYDLQGKWQLIGTYSPKQWTSDDPEIGADGVTYGFAAKAVDSAYVGRFVKAACNDSTGKCPSIPPLRAFLKFVPNTSESKPALMKVQEGVLSLPNEIEVEFVTEQTMSIAPIKHGRNGPVASDRWIDMKGRSLEHRPSAKGAYYNKGLLQH